ncbi:unnamed protein product [Allacma fusca]|uniref:BED-type domain-containing protein n=1 Tax=Allacma fusca TaxID=39272 RepID=A0A8J2KAB3_9HEXA|nr:unnamed protein product [Allacma fusca]
MNELNCSELELSEVLLSDRGKDLAASPPYILNYTEQDEVEIQVFGKGHNTGSKSPVNSTNYSLRLQEVCREAFLSDRGIDQAASPRYVLSSTDEAEGADPNYGIDQNPRSKSPVNSTNYSLRLQEVRREAFLSDRGIDLAASPRYVFSSTDEAEGTDPNYGIDQNPGSKLPVDSTNCPAHLHKVRREVFLSDRGIDLAASPRCVSTSRLKSLTSSVIQKKINTLTVPRGNALRSLKAGKCRTGQPSILSYVNFSKKDASALQTDVCDQQAYLTRTPQPTSITVSDTDSDWNMENGTDDDDLNDSSGIPGSSISDKKKTRKRHSSVWNHFEKCIGRNSSTCKFCKKELKTQNATNMKRHLQVCNPQACEVVNRNDRDVVDFHLNRLTGQKTLTPQSFTKHYTRTDPKQLKFRRKLAYFAATTTSSYLLLQTEEFRDCIRVADPKLRVPNRKTIKQDVKKLVNAGKDVIRNLLKSVTRITISSDIWSKKGQTSSYLGVLATFFDGQRKKKTQVLLALRRFSTVEHSSNDVIREMRHVIDSYDINPKQIWRAIVDGGSEMICSHRADNKMFQRLNREDIPTVPDSDDEYRVDEIEVEDVSPVHRYQGCIGETTTEVVDATMTKTYRRLTCFIHTLINCMKICDKDLETAEIRDLIQRSRQVVQKFKKSHVLTEALIKKTGVGVVAFCEIRWNYIFNVFTRLLRVKCGLNEVLATYGKAKYILNENDWDKIQQMVSFLEPFSRYTLVNQNENNAVSSEIIAMIISLFYHLDAYEGNYFLGTYSKKIKEKMKQRFATYLHNHDDNPIEGTYIAATLLDPRYRMVLPQEQRTLAKTFIINEYDVYMSEKDYDLPTSTEATAHHASQDSQQPSNPKFPFLAAMKQSIQRNYNSSGDISHQLRVQLDKYLECNTYDTTDLNADAFQFWNSLESDYPLLAPLALDYLSIPPSTASVESTFSYAGCLTLGRRHGLEGENLEDEVFLARNKNLFEELSLSNA